jgi:hypothetical protein
VGNQSHPVAPGQRPEASLAWGSARATAKRRQRVLKPCYGAPRTLPAASLRRFHNGGHVGTLLWPVCPVPPGSKNRAKAHEDSPGTWDARRLLFESNWRAGQPNRKAPGPRPASGLDGANTGARRGIVTRSTTKRDETVRRESERPIVPLKPGNPPAGTRGREGGAGWRKHWRETWPVRRNREPCARNNNA